MPKKSTEYVVRLQEAPERGKKRKPVEIAGPYFQRREALRALPKLLERYGWAPAVRAEVCERPARDAWRRSGRDEPKTWSIIARAEKRAGSSRVAVTETRSVA